MFLSYTMKLKSCSRSREQIWAWGLKPIVLLVERLRQEEYQPWLCSELQTSMGYSMRPSQASKTKKEVKGRRAVSTGRGGCAWVGEHDYYRAGLVLSTLGVKGVSVSHSKWKSIPAE